MSGPQFFGFSDRKEAVAYARATGLPLGRRRPGLKRLLPDLYFVGRFSAYHYETVDLPEEKVEKVPPTPRIIGNDNV